MARMVRKQFYIDAEEELFLVREAERLDVTQAEVVRRAIRALRDRPVADPRERAIEEFRALNRKIREENAALPPQPPYRFNREELYEERLARFGRRDDE